MGRYWDRIKAWLAEDEETDLLVDDEDDCSVMTYIRPRQETEDKNEDK